MSSRFVRNFTVTAIATLIVFVVGFVLGTLGGLADPDPGWDPWRVGLLVAVISAGIVLAIGSFIALIDASL